MLLLLVVWVMIAKKTYIFKSLDAPKQIMGWLQLDLDLGGGTGEAVLRAGWRVKQVCKQEMKAQVQKPGRWGKR